MSNISEFPSRLQSDLEQAARFMSAASLASMNQQPAEAVHRFASPKPGSLPDLHLKREQDPPSSIGTFVSEEPDEEKAKKREGSCIRELLNDLVTAQRAYVATGWTHGRARGSRLPGKGQLSLPIPEETPQPAPLAPPPQDHVARWTNGVRRARVKAATKGGPTSFGPPTTPNRGTTFLAISEDRETSIGDEEHQSRGRAQLPYPSTRPIDLRLAWPKRFPLGSDVRSTLLQTHGVLVRRPCAAAVLLRADLRTTAAQVAPFLLRMLIDDMTPREAVRVLAEWLTRNGRPVDHEVLRRDIKPATNAHVSCRAVHELQAGTGAFGPQYMACRECFFMQSTFPKGGRGAEAGLDALALAGHRLSLAEYATYLALYRIEMLEGVGHGLALRAPYAHVAAVAGCSGSSVGTGIRRLESRRLVDVEEHGEDRPGGHATVLRRRLPIPLVFERPGCEAYTALGEEFERAYAELLEPAWTRREMHQEAPF